MSPAFLKGVRLTHLYLGVFIAPALLFFAFTGAVQTFSLHETTRGSSYQPPKILVILAQIHKKQTPIVAAKKPQQDNGAPKAEKHGTPASPDAVAAVPTKTAAPSPPEIGRQHNTLPLKLFFLLVAIGLFVSTLSGLYMAYKYTRNKVAVTTLLVLGTVLPLLLLL